MHKLTMKMLRLITLCAAASVVWSSSTSIQAAVAGSPHDFSGESWNVSPQDPNSVCGPCHQPHNANSSAIPLWGHTMTAQSFTMYNTANVPVSQMKASPSASPTGPSLACLSCHDGVTAVNSYGGRLQGGSAVTITNSAAIGLDLTHSHPISFDYDAALVGTGPTQDKWLHNPNSTTVMTPINGAFTPGNDMTINGFLLGGNNRMECNSCHNVHNQEGSPFSIVTNPKLLKINGVGSDGKGSILCRSCHIK
jgi:hypothetical protein